MGAKSTGGGVLSVVSGGENSALVLSCIFHPQYLEDIREGISAGPSPYYANVLALAGGFEVGFEPFGLLVITLIGLLLAPLTALLGILILLNRGVLGAGVVVLIISVVIIGIGGTDFLFGSLMGIIGGSLGIASGLSKRPRAAKT